MEHGDAEARRGMPQEVNPDRWEEGCITAVSHEPSTVVQLWGDATRSFAFWMLWAVPTGDQEADREIIRGKRRRRGRQFVDWQDGIP